VRSVTKNIESTAEEVGAEKELTSPSKNHTCEIGLTYILSKEALLEIRI